MNIDNDLQQFALRSPGDDLEFDPQFHTLVRAIEGGEEVQYGERIYQPDEIDWRWGAELCAELLQRSLDLRVAVYQSHAWLMREGITGFRAGLEVLLYFVEQRWEDVHPQLLEEDNFDPLIRLNALAHLAAPNTAIAQLKYIPLVACSDNENICFSVLDERPGEEEAASSELREQCIHRLQGLSEPEEIAFFQTYVEELQALLAIVQKIHAALCQRVGVIAGYPLQPLENTLQRMVSVLRPYLKIPSEELMDAAVSQTEGKPQSATLALAGDCRSRHDVIQALDAICRYYKTYEPNSPVPLFISRSKKLVDMDFLQIITELSPESIGSIKNLAGLSVTDE